MLSLTRQERLVLIFLIFIFFLGGILHYVFKKNSRLAHLVNIIDSERIYPKVDPNKATYEELLKIPQIGPKTANRIIAYRERQGPFTHLDQIKTIEGISEKKYQTITKFLKLKSR